MTNGEIAHYYIFPFTTIFSERSSTRPEKSYLQEIIKDMYITGGCFDGDNGQCDVNLSKIRWCEINKEDCKATCNCDGRFSIFMIKTVNPFPNKPRFLRVCNTSLLKTLREKEKLLVTSNFSFSHSVFYPFGELYAIFYPFGELYTIFIQFEIVDALSFNLEESKICCLGKG